MYIKYYNDGKGKIQSHEMSFNEEDDFYNRIIGDIDIFSHNITDFTVYGESKEECYKKLQVALDYLVSEISALQILIDTDMIPVKEVDCTGKVLEGAKE